MPYARPVASGRTTPTSQTHRHTAVEDHDIAVVDGNRGMEEVDCVVDRDGPLEVREERPGQSSDDRARSCRGRQGGGVLRVSRPGPTWSPGDTPGAGTPDAPEWSPLVCSWSERDRYRRVARRAR